LAIKLPFTGYVLARGVARNRKRDDLYPNNDYKLMVTNFFAFLKRTGAFSLLEQLCLPADSPTPEACFDEILFEMNVYDRPLLQQFIKRRGSKTLVVPRYFDLYQYPNDVTTAFAQLALHDYIPLLDINDPTVPLDQASLAAAGSRLPFRIMDNQHALQIKLEHRLTQSGTTPNALSDEIFHKYRVNP
jgi:hypothetical protein